MAKFTRPQRLLIASAAALVFSRVFAFSLTTLGFTEYARGLAPDWNAATAALWAGVAFGAYGFTMAGAQLATGWLSDHIGRRRVLLGGSLLFVVGAVLCVFAESLPVLVLGRLVQGLGGISSVALAAVGESVPEDRRTVAMALVGIPAGLAVFLGFAVGPAIADLMGFASLFWATAALGVAAILPIVARPLPSPMPAPPQFAVARRAVVALALAGFTVNFGMMSVMFDFRADVLDDLGQATLGVILLIALFVMAAATRAIDRKRATWTPIVAALTLLATAAPAFRLASATLLVVAAGIVFFAAHAVLSATLPSQVSRISGRTGGRGHGIQLVSGGLGSAAGGTVAGALAGRPGYAFVLLAALALTALLISRCPALPPSRA